MQPSHCEACFKSCNEKGGIEAMPNIKSAKKRVKVTETKAAQNKAVKTNLKTVLKQTNAAIEAGADNKEEMVKLAIKKIDQACAKGILHKNAASRKKSTICNLAK